MPHQNVAEPRTERLTALGQLLRGLKRPTPDADAREAVAELFPQGPERVEYILRFAALIALSSSIAAFGLLADSSAVVIGAMLVAPLMTPILATAAATVTALTRELFIALAIIALGTVLAIAVGYAVAAIASGTIVGPTELPNEIRARTFPGLLDLGIAVTAGAAAGYILPRRKATGALPGVGIAVALVPPLATVGVTLESGTPDGPGNAFLLYLTNLAAIIFAASIMLLAAGFRPEVRRSRRHMAVRILVTLAAVIAVAIPLSIHSRATLEDNRLRSIVANSVSQWDPTARIVEMDADVDGDAATVEILVAGPNEPTKVWALAQDMQRRFGGPVDVDMRYARDVRFQVSVR